MKLGSLLLRCDSVTAEITRLVRKPLRDKVLEGRDRCATEPAFDSSVRCHRVAPEDKGHGSRRFKLVFLSFIDSLVQLFETRFKTNPSPHVCVSNLAKQVLNCDAVCQQEVSLQFVTDAQCLSPVPPATRDCSSSEARARLSFSSSCSPISSIPFQN